MRSELSFGLLAIALIFIIVGSYNVHGVKDDFDVECEDYVFDSSPDDDAVCGDFGIYWTKFVLLWGMVAIGVIFTITIKIEAIE